MRVVNLKEHLTCVNYEHTEKPAIEVVRIDKGQKKEFLTASNEIVFILEGRIKYSFSDYSGYQAQKGQMLFFPTIENYHCQALTPAMLIILHVHHPVMLCSGFSMEQLYQYGKVKHSDGYHPNNDCLGKLEINARIWHFLDGIDDCIADGLYCKCWGELKIKEFFILLMAYYPKDEIYDFLYLMLSGDMAFSEYVYLNWMRFRSVGEMAASMNITTKRFSARFVAVFGKTPYRWMQENRGRIVYREIIATKKPFKQIAIENGFSTDSMFTHFCKKELGKTPSSIREEKTSIGNNPQDKGLFW